MRLIALAAASLLSGLLHPGPKTTTQVYGQGEWRLTVVTDTFTQQVRCRLENHNGVHPDVTVERGALAFHFDPHLDTSNAWYTVDGGPPHAWRDLQAQLVQTGAMAQAEQLDNETGGVVLAPIPEMRGAAQVSVQPVRHAKSRSFRLSTLWSLIPSAKGLGYPIDDVGPISLIAAYDWRGGSSWKH